MSNLTPCALTYFSHFFLIKCHFLHVSQINKFLVDWCVLPYNGADAVMGHYGYITLKNMYIRTMDILLKNNLTLQNEYIERYIDTLDNYISNL